MTPLQEENTLLFGRHPVMDALEAGKPIDKILIQQGLRGEFEKEIRGYSRRNNIHLQVVPKERLNSLVRGNHQGIAAWLSALPYYLLEDVLPEAFESGRAPLVILLDGVTDVRNFGAIARSAELAGAHALVTSSKGSAPINAESIKTSAGALTKIPVCRQSSLVKAAEYCQLSGLQVIAGSLEAEQMPWDVDLRIPTALVLGAEGPGVSQALLRMSDQLFKIPQIGSTDSFNVSVAAGIMLYESMRQRLGS